MKSTTNMARGLIKKGGWLVSAALILLAVSGCSTQRSWVYSADGVKPGVSSQKDLVVMPFVDKREGVNKDNLDLAIVPLVLYTEAAYSVPEGQDEHVNSSEWSNYKPVDDFPKALVVELSQQQLFSNVRYSDNKKDAYYHVTGEILETDYNATMYTYGLSIYAPVAWALGAPMSVVSNTLVLKLELVDNRGNVVLSKEYSAPEYSERSWIYNTKNDFEYPVMLNAIYKDFTQDIVTLSL